LLLGEVGRGGAGIVFRARHRSKGQLAAVKLLLKGRFSTATERDRFCREAEAVAHLNHPNIVSLLEVGEDAGQSFIAMEWIEGQSLAQLVQKGLPTATIAAGLLRTIAAAVEYAHSKGIEHRDLKPTNILVDKDGEPHLTDFGLARYMAEQSGLTRTGELLGTAGFMAPELAQGKLSENKARADVYSLGAILYFLLTGRPPFLGSTFHETVQQSVIGEPLWPRRLNNAVPKALEAICLKCLSPVPTSRYPTAAALVEDLQSFLENGQANARHPALVRRLMRTMGQHPVVATAVVLGTLGVISSIVLLQRQNTRIKAEREKTERHAAGLQRKSTQLLIERGWMEQSHGDPVAAMAWFLAAWRNDPQSPERSRVHAARIEAVMPSAPELAFICAHEAGVVSVDFSSDGRLVLSASDDGTARVWNAETGAPKTELLRHPFMLAGARFTRDAKHAVTFSGDPSQPTESRLLFFWEIGAEAKLVWQAKAEAGIRAADLDKTGERIATGSLIGQVQIWDLRSGKAMTQPMNHAGQVRSVSFSPDGSKLLTSGWDNTAVLWNATTGARLRTFTHPGWLRIAQFSRDGSMIATGADDGGARVWKAPFDGDPIYVFHHQERVYRLAFSPDGRLLASASGDRTVKLWDLTSGFPTIPPIHHEHNLRDVVFSPDGQSVATASEDRTARLWRIADGEPLTPPLRHGKALQTVAFSPDGRRLATAAWDGGLRLWNVPQTDPVRGQLKSWPPSDLNNAVNSSPLPFFRRGTFSPAEPREPGRDLVKAAFSRDGRYGFSVKDEKAEVFDATTGRRISGLFPACNNSAEISRDGRMIASSPERGALAWWDTANGRQLGITEDAGTDVLGVAISPDSKVIAAAYGKLRGVAPGEDGAARLWDVSTGQPLTRRLEHPGRVDAVGFSPDGRRFATGCGDGLVRQWNTITAQPDGPALRHVSRVLSVEFSPDGKTLLTGTTDGSVRLWNAATGEQLSPAMRHTEHALATWSRDGRLILSWSADHTARLWDALSGLAITPPIPHDFEVRAAAFDPSERFFLTTVSRPYACLHQIPQGQISMPEVKHRIRLLACGDVDPNGDFQLLPPEELRKLWREQSSARTDP
jgi:WD40 repeat protein/predicted Ser/Thr protein kinase